MPEAKTKPTRASVDAYLASKASPEQRTDCTAIMAMSKWVTKQRELGHDFRYVAVGDDGDASALEALIAGSVAARRELTSGDRGLDGGRRAPPVAPPSSRRCRP